MSKKLRWGVLGVAAIAVKKVIPGMQKSELCDVAAIASRNLDRAKRAADDLKIPQSYGSYEELLADPDIDVIYNPLPNHLHVPWSIRAAEAGKHVLCEKPISLSVAEAKKLLAARDRGVKIGEAFMVRTHPQWLRTREIVRSGEIGELRAIVSVFSYFNRDAKNIRNVPDFGGGGLMDIGCYPITMSRFLFEREPARVVGLIERDPDMRTDRLRCFLESGTGEHAAAGAFGECCRKHGGDRSCFAVGRYRFLGEAVTGAPLLRFLCVIGVPIGYFFHWYVARMNDYPVAKPERFSRRKALSTCFARRAVEVFQSERIHGE
jgi:predicted dehydrogenase